jgi:uncharacterized coiled-coil DUF342 family protein
MMKKFRNVYKDIAPLIQKVSEMSDILAKELDKLDKKQKELDAVNKEVADKQAELDKIQKVADEKKETLEEYEKKLYAAENLISSLSDNKNRWEVDKNN